MATLPRFEAHVVIDGSQQVKVDAGAFAALTADDYFLGSKFVASSTSSLLAALQTVLAAAVGATTVALDTTTGIITITWGDAAAHALTFSSQAFATLLGFNATVYAAATVIHSDVCPPILWLPGRAVTLSGPGGGLGTRRERGKTQRAQSGLPRRVIYAEYTEQRFTFAALLSAKAWKASQGAATSFEQFWETALAGIDGLFRHYTDAGDVTSYTVDSVPRDYVFEKWEDPARVRPNLDTVWNLSFNSFLFTH